MGISSGIICVLTICIFIEGCLIWRNTKRLRVIKTGILSLMYFYQEPSGVVVHWRCYKNSSDLVDRPTGGASPELLPRAGFGARGFTQSSYYYPTNCSPNISTWCHVWEGNSHQNIPENTIKWHSPSLSSPVLCREPLFSISSIVSALAWTRGLGACLTSSFVSSAMCPTQRWPLQVFKRNWVICHIFQRICTLSMV